MSELNRREFAEALALAALVPMLGTLPGIGHLPAFTTAAGTARTRAGSLAKALAGAIRAQYGSRLSEADLATITRQIQSGLERADTSGRPRSRTATSPMSCSPPSASDRAG